ncbi:S8 family serine peptidase [Clostridium thermarum]|uniref:S8 family serine peptidase n=1 Tax=Clostridium thermarum TaxID=1716543 RepID=UPI0013D3834D|nr:S8 family serine peptidase [Clostridium thermarum]
MFLTKNKIDYRLKYSLDNKLYKKYRVNVYCRILTESTEKKIKSLKGNIHCSIPYLNFICATLTPMAIERLTELPEVEHITEDSYAFLCGSSILSANGVSLKGKYHLTGKGVGIALIDSGVYPHQDLQKPNNRIKKFVDLFNKYKYPYDDHGHGTFIAGLLCGSGYSSKGMYKGVAENSNLYVIKAFNSLGRGLISDILYALEIISEDYEEYNIRVACLPFEIMENDPYVLKLFSKSFDKLLALGIIPVVPSGSMGNEEGSITGIAALSNCITVGGLDTTSSNITSYVHSSSGPVGKVDKPNVAAACVDICSLNTNVNYIPEKNGVRLFPHNLERAYTTFTGTSCTAAYISGICAMLFENNSSLTFKDICSLLKVSSTMINISRWLQGSGIVDIHKLLP